MFKKPSDVTINEGEDAHFEAGITGKPVPVIEWLLGDAKLEPSDRIVYEAAGTIYKLTMKGCKPEETGSITIKATNDQGTISGKAKLTVKGEGMQHVCLPWHAQHVYGISNIVSTFQGIYMYMNTCVKCVNLLYPERNGNSFTLS